VVSEELKEIPIIICFSALNKNSDLKEHL